MNGFHAGCSSLCLGMPRVYACDECKQLSVHCHCQIWQPVLPAVTGSQGLQMTLSSNNDHVSGMSTATGYFWRFLAVEFTNVDVNAWHICCTALHHWPCFMWEGTQYWIFNEYGESCHNAPTIQLHIYAIEKLKSMKCIFTKFMTNLSHGANLCRPLEIDASVSEWPGLLLVWNRVVLPTVQWLNL